jgi:hypothetical protein
MMDGETGYDGVESTDFRKRVVQVMFDDLNFFVAEKSFAGRVQHRRGEVQRHAFGVGPVNAQHRQEPAVARSQIENALKAPRKQFPKNRFPFGAMRNLIRASQVTAGMSSRCVLIELSSFLHYANFRFQNGTIVSGRTIRLPARLSQAPPVVEESDGWPQVKRRRALLSVRCERLPLARNLNIIEPSRSISGGPSGEGPFGGKRITAETS